MKELVLRKGLRTTRVLLYSDIDQMPVDVFQRANKYWLFDDRLGSSIEDIDKKHLSKLVLVAGDKEKTIDAVEKLRALIYNILDEVNVESMAFACLVHSIDGEEIIDRSDENLQKIIKYLSDKGLTNELLKKKTYGNLFLRIWSTISRPSLRIRQLREAG